MNLWVIRHGNVPHEGNYLVDDFIGRQLWSPKQQHAMLFRSRRAAMAGGGPLTRVVRLKIGRAAFHDGRRAGLIEAATMLRNTGVVAERTGGVAGVTFSEVVAAQIEAKARR